MPMRDRNTTSPLQPSTSRRECSRERPPDSGRAMMPTIGKHSAMHLDTILATDFSPASYNAGLYASALSTHFHTNLIVVHACTDRKSTRLNSSHLVISYAVFCLKKKKKKKHKISDSSTHYDVT